jgi:hypothetical protein
MRKGRYIAVLIMALLLLIIGGSAWLRNAREREDSATMSDNFSGAGANADELKSRDRRKRGEALEKPKDPRLNILFNNDDFTLSPSKLDTYFSAVGRTDQSLAVVFLLTGDPSYMDELRKYPDSPVALAMLARNGGDVGSAKAAANRLVELAPENPQGHYFSAYYCAKEGDIDGALAGLKKVNELPGNIDPLQGEVYNEMFSALGVLGYGEVQANAYLFHKSQWFQDFQTGTREIATKLADSLNQLTEEERAVRAGAIVGLFQRLNYSQSDSLPFASVTQMANERSVLKKLPPDFGYGEDTTVADRLAELKGQISAESQLAMQELPALRDAEPSKVDMYFEIVRKQGLVPAREWLLKH